MISKVITGRTFYGACRYICKDKNRAVVLETEGVREHDYKLMAKDFEMQRALRPALKKAVFHGILSFYPGEKIEDEKMIEIGRQYLQELKIENTQYAITKHTDKNHQHLHIITNLVNNNGESIKTNWIGLRGKKAAQKLTDQYLLIKAERKNLGLTNFESLNENEVNRYIIYQAILQRLPESKTVDELKNKLEKERIQTNYKYKGQSLELQGISFRIGEYRYKGSDIDRNFSLKNLQKIIVQQQVLTKVEILQKLKLSVRPDLQAQYLELQKEMQQKNSILYELMKPELLEQTSLLLKKKKRKNLKRNL